MRKFKWRECKRGTALTSRTKEKSDYQIVVDHVTILKAKNIEVATRKS